MGRRTFVVAAVVVALVAVGAVVVVRSRGATDVLHTETGARRPNVLVIMTDDQTLESVRVMDNVKSRLMGEGTTFSSAYVSFPNCCPSRATYLTGQYAHNTGVKDNVPPLGGYTKLRADDTVALALQRSGYYTAHVGKYLN
ncbi:MAG: sulfatase-like hydrolase/transferase, partial [Acidimicrobiales bacterium]|nr:sulfatase-like hydrolase/transferase [Acidimicrobiales bacterium]